MPSFKWTQQLIFLFAKRRKEREDLLVKAKASGDQFRNAPYYAIAEPDMDLQWQNLIWPVIQKADFSCVLDLAAGHGRNSAKLLQHARKLIIVDINQDSIDACKARFKDDHRITYIKNDGASLKGVADGSVSLIYSFDSMVHFDSDVVRAYLKEFARALQPGGHGFCHHSNYMGNPGGDFTKSPHWRNFMSKELFTHYCFKEGLEIVEARVIDWSEPNLDCLTLFRKPLSSPARK